jgi:hypothetical protein
MFMFFGRATMKDIQMAAAIVGIPGLLVFFLSGWRERQKEREKKRREDSERRVFGPQGFYKKPRKIER